MFLFFLLQLGKYILFKVVIDKVVIDKVIIGKVVIDKVSCGFIVLCNILVRNYVVTLNTLMHM